MENHAWNTILAKAAETTNAPCPTQKASYYPLSHLQCDISCHLGYVWWYGQAIKYKGWISFSLWPSGGVRASCPACCSYIYLVKVWQHITLGFYYLLHIHPLTPFNKRTHRAQFSHPRQYPKAWSQRARMLKAEIQKLMRDWMTVHHSVTRSTHKPSLASAALPLFARWCTF